MITDGRFSGASRGPCVGHIAPEAWDGGPIACVRDGDIITIDLEHKLLQVELSDEELEQRRREIKRPDHPAPGVLKAYRDGVGGARRRPVAVQLTAARSKNGYIQQKEAGAPIWAAPAL